jgi:hypothetical protein
LVLFVYLCILSGKQQHDRYVPGNWKNGRSVIDIAAKCTGNICNYSEDISALASVGFMMATVVVVIVPVMIAYPFFQRYFIRGLTVGSVKG